MTIDITDAISIHDALNPHGMTIVYFDEHGMLVIDMWLE